MRLCNLLHVQRRLSVSIQASNQPFQKEARPPVHAFWLLAPDLRSIQFLLLKNKHLELILFFHEPFASYHLLLDDQFAHLYGGTAIQLPDKLDALSFYPK